MTLGDIIAKVNAVRPSEYDKYDMTQWINEIEFTVTEQIVNRIENVETEFVPYSYDEDAERDLILPDQFCGVYRSYLMSKIDLSDNEIIRYNIDRDTFDAEWSAAAGYYRRRYFPKGHRLHAERSLMIKETDNETSEI